MRSKAGFLYTDKSSGDEYVRVVQKDEDMLAVYKGLAMIGYAPEPVVIGGFDYENGKISA